jgi:hypothetical protein
MVARASLVVRSPPQAKVFRPSVRRENHLARVPGAKTPGYAQMFLADAAHRAYSVLMKATRSAFSSAVSSMPKR